MPLGDVLTLQRGFDLPARDREEGPFPIVSSAGVTGWHASAKADPPGVVIGRYGSLGSVHWITGPYWPLNTALWVKDFKGNDPRFVSYLLRTVAVDGSTASAVPGVNRNHLHRIPVRVASVATQRRTASVLAAFDELIEINERRIKCLEDLARSLFQAWFGGNASPMFSRATGSCASIGDFCTVTRGRSYRRDELSETGGVPFLNLKCVGRGGGYRASGLKRYTGRFKDAQRAFRGDVLVAVTDMTQERRIVAQAFRMPELHESFAVASLDLVIVRPESEALRAYLYAYLRYSDFASRTRHFANGANVLHLATERILEDRVLVPDEETATTFARAIDPLLTQREFIEHANRRLARARDLLLPRLVTGRLDISDIDLGDLLPADAEAA